MSTTTTQAQQSSKPRTVLFGLGLGALLGVLAHGTIGEAHADPAPAPQPRDDRPGPPPGGHRGPPPEAIEACNGKAAEAACSVTFAGKTHEGVCKNGPDGKGELACRPNDMPPPPAGGGHPHGPPPEAIAACEGKAESAACSVTHGDHTMQGTCRKGPDGQGQLACAPNGPPPAPPQK